jgi:hypothetical protein
LTWLPSAAWNVRRVVVSFGGYHNLDRTPWEENLAGIIPKGGKMTGSTEFFILSRSWHCDFTPMPFFSEAILPDDHWVLLNDYDYNFGRRIPREALHNRPIMAQGYVCPQAQAEGRMGFILLGPVGNIGLMAASEEEE